MKNKEPVKQEPKPKPHKDMQLSDLGMKLEDLEVFQRGSRKLFGNKPAKK